MTSVMLAYAIALLLFAVIDLAWIMLVAAPMYREALGDALAPSVRVVPAVAFYLLFPAGLVIFAINPALKDGSLVTAITAGALFGFFTYATYDLTNYATLKNWTFAITAIDIAYGAIVGGVMAATSFWLVHRFSL